ncbi:histidine kinase, partial [Acinetobacter nosocomialis]
STLENLYFDLRNVQEFIINKKYIDYSIMNCGVLVISDEEFIKGFEILSFSDNYFKYIINPYQISKNKIKLYDVDKMAYFIWENRADSFSEYTKEQYIKAYREFLNKLDIFIDSTDLRSYYHQ